MQIYFSFQKSKFQQVFGSMISYSFFSLEWLDSLFYIVQVGQWKVQRLQTSNVFSTPRIFLFDRSKILIVKRVYWYAWSGRFGFGLLFNKKFWAEISFRIQFQCPFLDFLFKCWKTQLKTFFAQRRIINKKTPKHWKFCDCKFTWITYKAIAGFIMA